MKLDKRLMWVLFALMIIIQVYVPASMIWSNEDLISEGKRMKFKVAPIDPNDPFKGKYVVLNFEHNTVPISKHDSWENGDLAYARLSTDSFGYYFPASIHKDIPEHEDYLEMKISYVDEEEAILVYPFNKFYMEESKAPIAEDIYMNLLFDSLQETYAVVYVKEGKAVLHDVQIDGVSILDLVELSLLNER